MNAFVNRYQRSSKEWNQAIQILSIKKKTFKEAAEVLGTSSTSVIRRFKKVAKKELTETVKLPKAIAIDEYKGDTDAGEYQLIIANADTHEPIGILPNRRKATIKHYLQQHGQDVQIVVMDMNPSFKAGVQQALGKPIIVAIFIGQSMRCIEKSRQSGMIMIERSVNVCVMYFINVSHYLKKSMFGI